MTVVLYVLHFGLYVAMPVYNKELFAFAPYPVFCTLLQIIISVPVSYIVGAIRHKSVFRWLRLPRRHILGVILGSLSYGFMLAASNIGLFKSNLDYAILIRFSGTIVNGLFAVVFLGERLCLKSWIGVIVIGIGMILVTIEQDGGSLPSYVLLVIQILANVFSAFSSILMKKVVDEAKQPESSFSLWTVHFWRFVLALIPLGCISAYMEKTQIGSEKRLKFVLFIILGVVLTQLFQFIGLKLHAATSVLTSIVLNQLKLVLSLVIAHVAYRKSAWTIPQIVGSLCIAFGTGWYTYNQMKQSNQRNNDDREQVPGEERIEMEEQEMDELSSSSPSPDED